ncbi:hypothetical protein ACFCYX_07245 [Streptomyces populi]|uniref:hypothetical protein n=1 Tax=Streptomyces populi TaxID=2058924 RepID=UPI0013A6A79C|nr:hypothetical protein [Streptomyces populi]
MTKRIESVTLSNHAEGALGVAAYADGLMLPLLLCGIATVLGYALTVRHWHTVRELPGQPPPACGASKLALYSSGVQQLI